MNNVINDDEYPARFVHTVNEMAGRVVNQQGRRLESTPSTGRLHAEWHLWLRQRGIAGGRAPVRRVRHMRPAQVGPSKRFDQVLGAKTRLVLGNSQTIVVETRSKGIANVLYCRSDRLQHEAVYMETG